MLHRKKMKLKRKILYNRSTHFLILSSCEKSQICFLLNVLYSHPVWVFSVFPICPSEIGSYREWSIKRRGAYFIFQVKSAALIREGRLFQLQVKHKGEYRERTQSSARKRTNMHTSNCYMNLVSKVPAHYNFRTHDWVVVLFVKRYGFDVLLYQAP